MTTETWKAVKGYEGLYEVSNFGNVRSVTRVIRFERRGSIATQVIEGKPLKPGNSKGYKNVVLCNKDGKKTKGVHRLVAEAFIDNPLDKPEVNHIDENPSNNTVENLEWVTHVENSRHGTRGQRIAEANTGNPLTSRQIFQYSLTGELVGTYASPRVAEIETGISRASISSALHTSKTHRLKGYIWKFE